MAKTCYAAGCGARIGPKRVMCFRHWFKVPALNRFSIIQATGSLKILLQVEARRIVKCLEAR